MYILYLLGLVSYSSQKLSMNMRISVSLQIFIEKIYLLSVTDLSVALEHIALKDVSGPVSGDIREYLQIGAVVRYIEDTIYRVIHNLCALIHRGLSAAEQLGCFLQEKQYLSVELKNLRGNRH